MTWYNKYLIAYDRPLEEVPDEVIAGVAERLARLQSPTPLVTVSVIAYNEERNLIACLWALSEMKCKYPVEIIGVNNNSKDRTEEIFQKAGIPYFNESRNSCGYARQCGLLNAKGRFHVNIDADTLYPPLYVETMVEALSKPRVVAVSSLWSYIPDANHSKISLLFYEAFRDLYLFFQSVKRPELSVRGLVFAYNTELALKIGIRTDIKRGEDGSLALGLKKYGTIAFVRTRKARAVTGYGTLAADGSLTNSFKVRLLKGLKSVPALFASKSHYQDEESNLIDGPGKSK
ncbi:MAG: glycosyl transferase family A [Bacteroidales bacterium 45-6]|nr:MAG: glycosyl transferase family A [Bacteroidales bacterium 45-6]